MDALLTTQGVLALVTLTFLEIVLGVDNVIFISILSSKLPAALQPKARRTGLLAAMLMRIALLLSIAWIIRLTAPLFTIFGRGFSGRDLILMGGGLFLLALPVRRDDQPARPARGDAARSSASALRETVIIRRK